MIISSWVIAPLAGADQKIVKQTHLKNVDPDVTGPPMAKAVYRSLKHNKKHLDKKIQTIEYRIVLLVKADQQDQLILLKSIPDECYCTTILRILCYQFPKPYNYFNNCLPSPS